MIAKHIRIAASIDSAMQPLICAGKDDVAILAGMGEQFADVFDALADTPAEAADLKARSDLLSALADQVKAREMIPRSAAARRLGIELDRLDDLRQGKLSRFSHDDLVSLTAVAEAA